MLRLNAKKYIIAAAVILLLIFLHYAKLLNPIEALLSKRLKPLFNGLYSLSSRINQTYLAQTQKQDLVSKLKQAEEKINQLTSENAKLKFLEEENLALRKNLNFLNKAEQRFLLANIISRGEVANNSGDSQSIVIDRGLSDGLLPGLAVVSSAVIGTSSQGVIIGKVINVKDNISEIYLVTNKKCKLAASILGENNTAGITQGELGLTVKMDFIPQTENIKVNDIVATSGLEQNIPRGLVIGRVAKVSKENNEVWQSASIEPQINLDALTVVAILLP